MVTKYAEQIKAGDVIGLSAGELQVVKRVRPTAGRGVCMEFESNHTLIVSSTTQLPVVQQKKELDFTTEEVYNLILDDKLSLTEFTIWLAKQ